MHRQLHCHEWIEIENQTKPVDMEGVNFKKDKDQHLPLYNNGWNNLDWNALQLQIEILKMIKYYIKVLLYQFTLHLSVNKKTYLIPNINIYIIVPQKQSLSPKNIIQYTKS